MPKPYTIRLFVPDGDPNKFKIINKMNWTGVGLEISREAWDKYKNRAEFSEAGIYILAGYDEAEDLPTIYVGQGDGVKKRIDDHYKNKMFWNKVLVFVSSNGGLNRAHITWLEWALIQEAQNANRCKLDNSNTPAEPILTESEKADTKEFLNEILSILPLVEMRVFEKAEKIDVVPGIPSSEKIVQDTIIVPAQEDGFHRVFLGKNCWNAVRISGGRLNEIKFIAAYQTAPISAITHYAEVESIEPYGDGGKYQLNFKGPAQSIEPIKFGNAPSGAMQSIRYTSLEKLKTATELMDLLQQ